MTERLLQFIWQFQYFNSSQLSTSQGEALQVFFPGQYNTDQGPDFSGARIRIGETTWAGRVELHLKASDWNRHHHGNDENYHNVILHVVWKNDWSGENGIPILELGDRISSILLERYENLMESKGFIPCEKNIHMGREITWEMWKTRLLVERFERKSGSIDQSLAQSNYHWEETFWRQLARNFGMRVNADLFEQVARSIPQSLLTRHKAQVHQLEALLLGQANLLKENFTDAYPVMLSREYEFLKKKYSLRSISATPYFLRMRPGNFPTIRLAQLAVLIQQSVHLFSKIREAEKLSEIISWFDVTANDYWHYHYRFDEPSVFSMKKIGKTMIENLIINTIAPMLYAYGAYHGVEEYKQRSLGWLAEVHAENNPITKSFSKLKVENRNAFDSQALLELKNEYCSKKKCLSCAIGNDLLKGGGWKG